MATRVDLSPFLLAHLKQPTPKTPHRNRLHTLCLKKVAHHTLRNIFAQGWPIAKISTATESEIISKHKCIINVLIFNVPNCCHLANWHVSNWQLCVHKNCTYFEGLWADRHFLPVCCLLINCIGKPFFLLKQMLGPITGHSTCFVHRIFRVPTRQCPAHWAKETVALLTNETPDFIPSTLWPPNF